ncbi:MAG: HD domain-containing protein [Candidatus Diapherotrites archaeon]|nr:HD domain-containing protein [Candidatus Diapherotrites archaeon]
MASLVIIIKNYFIEITLICFILILGAYCYSLFFKTKSKDPSTFNKSLPELEISLEELAKRIWLKFNDEISSRYYDLVILKPEENQINSPKEPSSETLPKTDFSQNDLTTSQPIPLEKEPSEEIVKNFIPATNKPEEPFSKEFFEILEQDQELAFLYDNVVKPYKKYITEQNVAPLIEEAIKILHIKGTCSSLSGVHAESIESDSSYSIYKDVLSKVSLKEHTVNVAHIIVERSKFYFQNHTLNVPKLLVLSLYHDLGKIPEYSDSFKSKDLAHQYISANILTTIAQKHNVNVFWLDEVIKLIKEHHIGGTKDVFGKLLSEADKKARLIELSKYLSGFEVKPFELWFSLQEFLSDLTNYVNVDHYGPKWYAFSFNGVLYVKPDKIYDLVDEQRKRKKVLCEEFTTYKDKESRSAIINKVIKMLASKNLLTFQPKTEIDIKCPKYKIFLKDGKSFEITLLPIKMSYYSEDEISSMEKRKWASFFSAILDVSPVKTG